MDQIRETLGRLGELSDEELDQLSDAIVTEFESAEAQDLSAEVVDSMTELAAAIDAVSAEKTRRTEEAAELSRRRDEAAARIKGARGDADNVAEDVEPEAESAEAASVDETPAEVETNVSTEMSSATPAPVRDEHADIPPAMAPENRVPQKEQDGAEAVEVVAAAEEPEPAPEPVEAEVEAEAPAEEAVTADAGAEVQTVSSEDSNPGKDPEAPVTAAANEGPEVQAPADRRPKATARATVSITAGADIQGVAAGSDLPNMRAVAEAMAKRMHSMRRTSGGDGEQHTVATFVADYPEERVLRGGEPEANKVKIDNVASPQAIIAAGGFCAPLETNYEILGFGVTDRPVRDSLASFTADRGGIRWMQTPVLGDLPTYGVNAAASNPTATYDGYLDSGTVPADGAAISVWNLQADLAATDGSPTKPCFRVECIGEDEAYLEAVPVCLTIGNLMARAFPELIEANNNLAMVTHARFSEQRLLTRIGSLSTPVTAATYLGAVRDFFNQVDRAAVAYRNRHRLADNESMRVIAPNWLKHLLRADLVNSFQDGLDALTLADSQINAWFRARNINVTWALDGEAGQYFNPQSTPGAALENYPQTVIWYIFAEGTFLFLDGGTLDLGLVRDSTLNATNDYKMFVETFEGVAMRGVESLRVSVKLLPNGTAAGTTTPSTTYPIQ